MGWVLTGNGPLADRILLEAMEQDAANPLAGPYQDPFENLFAWAFGALDRACSDKGVVRPLHQAVGPNSNLAARLHALPYELRVATLLISIEGFDAAQAQQISGRSAFALASAATAAVELLDVSR